MVDVTLTKLKGEGKYACSLKDFLINIGDWKQGKNGKGLLEIEWQRTSQNRIIITLPKKNRLLLG